MSPVHNLGLQVSVETSSGKTRLKFTLRISPISDGDGRFTSAARASFRFRPEHQPQGGGPGGTGRRVGEAALHGGVLQSQRSAHSLAPLRRWEAPAAESQPVHAAAGRIQRPGPGRSVTEPSFCMTPGTSGQIRLFSAPFGPRARLF